MEFRSSVPDDFGPSTLPTDPTNSVSPVRQSPGPDNKGKFPREYGLGCELPASLDCQPQSHRHPLTIDPRRGFSRREHRQPVFPNFFKISCFRLVNAYTGAGLLLHYRIAHYVVDMAVILMILPFSSLYSQPERSIYPHHRLGRPRWLHAIRYPRSDRQKLHDRRPAFDEKKSCPQFSVPHYSGFCFR